eukprot:CAMPEP_0204283542 /NCGR_PEP_ID=MMETSP0468-20130131/46339_1 /ASSEMBLY_ACC=CAM_ASM_000383 /TAXON_ID=2969 /ORGANISM="Oxyrrhis marina" /LENGTH=447 /DNA_ID=CAMNT_0051261153 /DNA_START=20 /DNA_END=1360 /DNA_ORIENTATION=-
MAQVICFLIYVLCAYAVIMHLGHDLVHQGHSLLGHTVSYFMVFRANVSYQRYWLGRTNVTDFFLTIRDLMSWLCIMLEGGEATRRQRWWREKGRMTRAQFTEMMDAHDYYCSESRANIVRWCVAFAVTFKMYIRMAADGYINEAITPATKWALEFDRARLRGLLSPSEFHVVDNTLGFQDKSNDAESLWMNYTKNVAIDNYIDEIARDPERDTTDGDGMYNMDPTPRARPPVILVYYLHEELFRNLNDARLLDKPYGFKERFGAFFTQKLFHVLTLYDLVNQTICTPTPLPYVNMCRTLLAVYLLLTPFSIQLDLGWYANTVVPTLVAVSLLGLDQISTELENPFGDDPNDLDMLDEVGMVEHEAMFLLQMCGDKLAREHYVWKPMPEFVQAQSARPLPCYLAIRSQVDPTGPGPVLFDKYPIRKPVAVEHLIESSGDEEDGTDGGS